MKLYVFFEQITSSDVDKIDRSDAILTMQHTDEKIEVKGTLFEAFSFDIDYFFVSERVKLFFQENIPFLEPYANAFYQCTIVPLMKCIKAFEFILDSKEINEIIFPYRVFWSTGKPNYFLGEYESHSVFLYNRTSCFQPYLEKIGKDRCIPIRYLKRPKLSFQYFANKLRLSVVFLGKLAVDFKKMFSLKTFENKDLLYKYIFNIRNYSQFEFISYLLSTETSYLVSVYESFYSLNLKKQISHSYRDKVYFYSNYSFRTLIKNYLYSIFKVYSLPNKYLQIDLIIIDITQSLKECLMMLPELLLYNRALNNFLKMVPQQSGRILFTTEQKSPHAFVDAQVGYANGYKVVHLMLCDQHPIPLPHPIPGDLYVVNSMDAYNDFHKVFSINSIKLAYLGSIKSLPFNSLVGNRDSLARKYIVCYFSMIDKPDLNLIIVNILIEQFNKDQIIVKLHPRDKGKWTKGLPVKVVHHGEYSFNELFSFFQIAITPPSSVAMDLIGKSIPIVFLNLPQERDMQRSQQKHMLSNYALDPSYKNVIYQLDELPVILNDINSIKKEFNRVINPNKNNFGQTADGILKAIEGKLFNY